jgi:hypothetical protein
LARVPLGTTAPNTQRLTDILARPEFSRARQRYDIFSDLGARFREWLLSLAGARATESFARWTRWLVLLLAGATAALALLRWARRGHSARRAAPGPKTPAGALRLEDPAVHLSRARETLARDARGAIREGVLALLSALELGRWARPDRVKTNRELAGELPQRGAPASVVSTVTPLLGWYDRAFYSLAPVPAGDAARFVDDVSRAVSALRAAMP